MYNPENTAILIIGEKKSKVEVFFRLIENENHVLRHVEDEEFTEIVPNKFFGMSMYEMFPMALQLKACGCRRIYKDINEFPDGDQKCRHGNYFVKYEFDEY